MLPYLRNAELKEMKAMKKNMNKDLGNVISRMMTMMGQDPMDLLTEEQVRKVLKSTFDKFDKDKSDELERPEFHKAWEFLGLEGTTSEVDNCFTSVGNKTR